jgi:hypothetical protein
MITFLLFTLLQYAVLLPCCPAPCSSLLFFTPLLPFLADFVNQLVIFLVGILVEQTMLVAELAFRIWLLWIAKMSAKKISQIHY